jgi:hypothetical protein
VSDSGFGTIQTLIFLRSVSRLFAAHKVGRGIGDGWVDPILMVRLALGGFTACFRSTMRIDWSS